ncbi:MAG: hypothetical protein ACRDJL_00855, partial [Actinomycetota bacterium]
MREKRVSVPEDFVGEDIDGTEAIVIRIGAGEAQLVLVDREGRWDRWVYRSVEECTAVARGLGISGIHEGEFPERTRVRMNAYQKSEKEFEAAAYPEQGEVGPVIPYPENRPRRAEDPERERSEGEGTR